jgi:cell division protein FtsQ
MGDSPLRGGGRPVFKAIAIDTGARDARSKIRREAEAARPLTLGAVETVPRPRKTPKSASSKTLSSKREREGTAALRGGAETTRPDAEKRHRSAAARREPGAAQLRSHKALLIALGLIALLSLGLFSLPSLLRVRSLEVLGATTMSSAEVAEASLVTPGSPLLAVDTGRVEAALLASPAIAEAKVSKVFPSRIRIEIVERRPVAVAIADIGGRSSLVAIDATGTAFARAEAASVADLPVLSGLRFEDWKPGTKLPDFLLPLLESLAAVEMSDPTLLALFSEIRIERSRYGELELLLFPLHNALPVRTGARLNPTLLRSIVLVLDALSTRGLAGIDEIDFRTGTIVFRTKEGHSG